jgi:hypothetical protein
MLTHVEPAQIKFGSGKKSCESHTARLRGIFLGNLKISSTNCLKGSLPKFCLQLNHTEELSVRCADDLFCKNLHLILKAEALKGKYVQCIVYIVL